MGITPIRRGLPDGVTRGKNLPMRTLGWITDPHFNFLDRMRFDAFVQRLEGAPISGLLLGGDLAEAPSVVPFLTTLDARLPYPIYFVLGNHDYYHGGIETTRHQVARWVRGSARSHWLARTTVVPLTEKTGLVGHGGWGDARAGDFANSPIRLNDYRLIKELTEWDRGVLAQKLQALGDEAAAHLDAALDVALSQFDDVIVLTHVPPFVEACWHEGQISDHQWSPHFTCLATGDVLLAAAAAHPDRRIHVLCGHTHGAGRAMLSPNLTVSTGGAEYGAPALQELLYVR